MWTKRHVMEISHRGSTTLPSNWDSVIRRRMDWRQETRRRVPKHTCSWTTNGTVRLLIVIMPITLEKVLRVALFTKDLETSRVKCKNSGTWIRQRSYVTNTIMDMFKIGLITARDIRSHVEVIHWVTEKIKMVTRLGVKVSIRGNKVDPSRSQLLEWHQSHTKLGALKLKMLNC